MAQVILMPKMSDTMEEGVIAKWLKKIGDSVKSGETLAEVETDKATMELESYETGTILYLAVEAGGSVKVDGLLAIVGKEGEDFQALLQGNNNPSTIKKEEPVAITENKAVVTPTTTVKITNAKVIAMPKMSDTMEEGVIVNWLKKVGDPVKSGEILAEVETDKATMELESYETGTVLYLAVEAGGSVKVDGLLAIVGEKGADYQALVAQFNNPNSQTADTGKTESQNTDTITTKVQENESKGDNQAIESKGEEHPTDGRIKISPLAKALAKEKGIDTSKISGTGDFGRIVKKDVENFKESDISKDKKTTTPSISQNNNIGSESFEEIPLSQMRKTIARRLSESKFTAPHFYLTMEINMDQAIEARKQMNETSPVKISFNDMVVKAVAMALRKNPKINASWLGDKIRYNHHINIGIAVAVDEGLLVPVVRFADSKSLAQISAETKELAQKAKDKKLQPSEWEGNTFSISNLGMFGIDEFTAIINPPDACILAVGGIKETAVVKNGQLVIGNLMKVTMSCDHRVVDGALGAAFLQSLKELLEAPVRMLI